MELIRTNSSNTEFQHLVALLDAELRIRDGDEHAFYAQYNKIDHINHVVVAFINNKAIGCGAIKHFEDNVVEVKRMFILLDERGKGYASKILIELEKWSKELGYNRCILETGIKQPEAIALYTKSKYNLIPNYGQYINVENSLCFEKVID